METQRPLPVETLTYQTAADDVWPRIIRVLAVVALVVGITRLANGVLYLWFMGTYGGGIGSIFSPMTLMRILPVFITGPILLIGACGMLMNQRWGKQLAVVSEYISLSAFPILLMVLPFQAGGQRDAMVIYQITSSIVSVIASLAFPLVLIGILRIHKSLDRTVA